MPVVTGQERLLPAEQLVVVGNGDEQMGQMTKAVELEHLRKTTECRTMSNEQMMHMNKTTPGQLEEQ
jgi:hypothetical protein